MPADLLEGGTAAWAKAGLPLVNAKKLPRHDKEGRTVWGTRARPKIGMIPVLIACSLAGLGLYLAGVIA